MELKYRVTTFREVGLTARWSKTRLGAPIIVVSNPESKFEHEKKNYYVNDSMWKQMKELGVKEGFESSVLLGDIFFLQS